MSGREIIQEALEASNRSGSLSPRAADWFITRMSRAGYRIIGPEHEEAIKQAIDVLDTLKGGNRPAPEWVEATATALRALTEAKP